MTLAPNNVAFVVGYKTCIVDDAKRAITYCWIVSNKVTDVVECERHEPCFATSALARSTNAS